MELCGKQLTREEPVKQVEKHKDQYGLNTCLDAIELLKSTWYCQKKEKVEVQLLEAPLLDGIRAHPAYGYRRILPKLRDWGYEVGEFVVRRLLKHGNLRLVRSIRKPRLSRLRKYLKQTEYRWLQAVSIRERRGTRTWNRSMGTSKEKVTACSSMQGTGGG